MNIFYAPPEQFSIDTLELRGREASHATKTLRYKEGDSISVVDGQDGWYEGTIQRITQGSVWVEITSKERKEPANFRVTTAIGLIKKKDRLEFAVEKAVELGASEIVIFRGEHSVKQNVRIDRLETIALSAMKQSLQARLPQVKFFNSLHALLQHYTEVTILAAHQTGTALKELNFISPKNNFLLITGPEGDFSDNEMELLQKREVPLAALGQNRYRTETASIIFLNSFSLYFG